MVIEIQVPCPACGGGGILGYVSRDMALDACEPAMEGTPIPCDVCNGDGWVIDYEEIEDDTE